MVNQRQTTPEQKVLLMAAIVAFFLLVNSLYFPGIEPMLENTIIMQALA